MRVLTSYFNQVLNALSIDPGRQWKGVWRWFSETQLQVPHRVLHLFRRA